MTGWNWQYVVAVNEGVDAVQDIQIGWRKKNEIKLDKNGSYTVHTKGVPNQHWIPLWKMQLKPYGDNEKK